MKNKYIYIYPVILLLCTSCSTLNESVKLGASLGAATGVAAIHAGHSSVGEKPTSDNVAVSAGIGLVLGVITSYMTHQSVEEKHHAILSEQTEMHFGDLPPSPFIFPRTKK